MSDRDPDDDVDRERRRVAHASLAESGGEAGGCPDQETLWAAARGELSRPRLTALRDHVRRCPSCHEAWRLARAFGAEGAPAGVVVPVVAPPASPLRRRAGLLAAALAPLLLGAGFLWHAYSLYPSLPKTGRSSGVETPAELGSRIGATLPRDDFVLEWQGVEEALYRLEVYTDDHDTVVAEAGLGEPRYRVPPERLADLPAGTLFTWQVTAVLPGGEPRVSPRYRVGLR